MTKEKSFINHILINVFLVTITIVFIVLVIVWLVLFNNYQNNVRNEVHASLSQKAEQMRFEFEKQIYKSDHVVGNMTIIEKLDKYYDDGYELMMFVNEINTFIDALEQIENKYERIVIYTTNPSLIESKYLRNMSRLTEYEDKLKYFNDSNQRYYWDENIYTDSSGMQYIVLLRHLPIANECIIEMKLYFDKTVQDNDYVDTCRLLTKMQLAQDKSDYVSENVFENFYLEAYVTDKDEVRQGIRYLMYLILCALVFISVAFILVAVSMRHTLKDIMILVEQIDGKDWRFNDTKRSKWSELKKIQDNIYMLNKQIYDVSKEKYEMELMKKKLEIENLNFKINPHMLYNSLSIIKMSAFRKKDYETEKIVELLVDYYRLMLNKGEEKIKLGQELAYLEKYIKINEISKKTCYEVEIDITNEAYNIMIPQLILQPIVENALFHGFSRQVDEPYIKFFASVDNENLKIEICDNGIGIDEEKRERMNNREEMEYGLKNVLFRLDYYYGNGYIIRFEPGDTGGTRVLLEIQNINND